MRCWKSLDASFPLPVESDKAPIACADNRVAQVEAIAGLEAVPLCLPDKEPLEMNHDKRRGIAIIELTRRQNVIQPCRILLASGP